MPPTTRSAANRAAAKKAAAAALKQQQRLARQAAQAAARAEKAAAAASLKEERRVAREAAKADRAAQREAERQANAERRAAATLRAAQDRRAADLQRSVNAVEAAKRDAYNQMRALREVERHTAAQVAASDLSEGRNVIDLAGDGDPHFRTLLRPEPFWWAVGRADGDGVGDQVLAVAGETLPELLSLEEAGKLLPSAWNRQGTPRDDSMTVDGVGYLIQSGDLYALYALDGVPRGQYGSRRRRYVFRLQVEWLALERRATALELADSPAETVRAAAAEARLAWMRLRELLPDVHRSTSLRSDVTPRSAPVAVKGGQPAVRQKRALLLGDRAGWFSYVGLVEGGYLVEVGGVERVVEAGGVLAYVLGVADAQRPSQGRLVAYREGLG